MDGIKVMAPAKINLVLDVIGKRADGYHNLRMIMQTVSLYDELEIRWTPEKEDIVLNLSSPVPGIGNTEDNLVYKAANLIREYAAIDGGFEITLHKRIPVAAGMAGGSTDCAAALLGLNQLMKLNLTIDKLCEMGLSLGADVPFCIRKGTALAEGIGDELTCLTPPPLMHILLVKPDIEVSTAFIYKNLNLAEQKEHPDVDGMINALRCQDAGALTEALGNVLESVAIPAFPVIARVKQKLEKWGADGVLMSGSGPTVFALFKEESIRDRIFQMAKDEWPSYFVYAAEFCQG